MPTLPALLKTEIDLVESYDDPNDIFKKVVCKANMAIKANNQNRMERYLAMLLAIPEPTGGVTDRGGEPGEDDAASDE